MKVIYSGLYGDSGHPFHHLPGVEDVEVARHPDDLKVSDAGLIIWGGSDISPDFYGHAMHSSTYPGGMRDKLEWGLMQRAIELGMPIFGVCRGAQMLCAAAGGWLIQDVRGHAGSGHHLVETFDGQTFNVNSIHHQMMCGLEKVDHELVGWSKANLSPTYATAEEREGKPHDTFWTPPSGWREPEFVYFRKINGYAIQWHPEGMSAGSDASKYVLDYIARKEDERSNRDALSCNC